MNKNGFTLLELLVVVAIIGMISTTLYANLSGARYKAHGVYLLRTTLAIEKAFAIKGIKEGKFQWWDIADFPGAEEWEEVIDVSKLIDEGAISEFLPVLPDGIPSSASDGFGAAPYQFTFAYQNYFPSSSTYTDPSSTLCDQANYTHNVTNFYSIQNGISLIIRPDYDYESDKFQETFKYLDNAIDGGDGQNCGKFRVITYPNWLAMYLYTMSPTVEFNH